MLLRNRCIRQHGEETSFGRLKRVRRVGQDVLEKVKPGKLE